MTNISESVFDPSAQILLQYIKHMREQYRRPVIVGVFGETNVGKREVMERIMEEGARTNHSILGFGYTLDNNEYQFIVSNPRFRQSSGIVLNCGNPIPMKGSVRYEAKSIPRNAPRELDLTIRVEGAKTGPEQPTRHLIYDMIFFPPKKQI